MKKKLVVAIIMVLLLIPNIAQATDQPLWAFSGAYLEYKVSGSIISINTTGTITFVINKIFSNSSFLCTVYTNLSGDGTTLSNVKNFTGTFDNPGTFPVVNSTILSYLNKGEIPPYSGFENVTKNVLVSVPAGNYITDEVTSFITIEWIDSSTGIIVKEQTAHTPILSLVLIKTNISSEINFLPWIALITTLAIFFIIIIIILRRKIIKK